MKKYILITILIFSVVAEAQETRNNDPFYLYESIPSSPEVAGLGQYGKIGASSYNGKANISIPIYTLNFEGMQIPIQLSYDSGGVQVAQEASWVGLNWNLSANFGISRRIYGYDDFSDNFSGAYYGAKRNGYIYNTIIPELQEGQINPILSYDDIIKVHYSYAYDTGGAAGPKSYLDTQPDVFTANLFGASYTFIFEKKGTSDILQTKVFNNNNVVITYDLSNQKFTLVDENGFTYEFATKEVNTTFSSVAENATAAPGDYQSSLTTLFANTNRSGDSTITNWSLDKVTAPRGQILEFEYQKGAYFSFPRYSFDYPGSDGGIALPNTATRLGEDFPYMSSASKNNNIATTIIENNYLTAIKGDFGEVQFHLEDRLDLSRRSVLDRLTATNYQNFPLQTSQNTYWSCQENNPPCEGTSIGAGYQPWKLSGISVKNNQDKTVVDAQFSQSYFNSLQLSETVKERYLRLKLDGITINGKEHRFEYIDPNDLPAKDSFGVDFWGFANGKDNEGYVPRIGRFITSRVFESHGVYINGQSFVRYDGANRASDFSYGKKGLLSKIVYPTKGSTTLAYEPHEIVRAVPAAFKVTEYLSEEFDNQIRWTNMTDESKFDITYQYLKCATDSNYNYFTKDPNYNTDDAVTTEYELLESMTVTHPSLIQVDADLITQYPSTPSEINEALNYWGNHPILVAEEIHSGQEYTLFTYSDGPSNRGAENANSTTATVVVPPGIYIVKQATAPAYDEDAPTLPAIQIANSDVFLHSFENIDANGLKDFYETFEIGGARVQKIIHKDEEGNFASGTAYKYNYLGAVEGLASSGKLMDDLIFYSKASGFHSYNPRGYSNSFYLKGTNQVGGNHSAQGSHIGYSFTQEFQIDKDSNSLGWIDKTYHNLSNAYFQDSFSLPFAYDSTDSGDDPHFKIFGTRINWTCSGGIIFNGCGNPSKLYSELGDVAIQNTILLGLPLRLSFDYLNGSSLKEEVYKQDGTPLRIVENEYTSLGGNIPLGYFSSFINEGMTGITLNDNGEVETSIYDTTEGPWASDHHTYFPYKFPSHHGLVSKLASTTTTEYFEDKALMTERMMDYNETSHFLTHSKNYINEEDYISQYLYYPYDDEVSTNSYMGNLISENRLATVIKTVQFEKDKKLQTIEYQYHNSVDTANKTLVTGILSAKASEPFEKIMNYEKYNAKGNPLQVRKEDDIPVVYIWGYQQTQPIAKIENATYDQVTNYVSNLQRLSNLDNDRTIGTEGAEGALRSALNNLRNVAELSSAQITTYTYDPLIGVTSITDPRGQVVYYQYDEYHRLEHIKDQNGKIVQHHEYQYKQ